MAKAVMVSTAPTSDILCVVPGMVTPAGTVKATVPPAGEWREEQTTDPPGMGQFTIQSTPKLAGSPTTVAPNWRIAPAGAELGKGEVMVRLVTVDVIEIVAEEDLLRSVVDSAVTATVFPEGTPVGAVNMVVAPLAV